MGIGQCVTLAEILLIMFRLPMAATYAALAMYGCDDDIDCVFHTQTGR